MKAHQLPEPNAGVPKDHFGSPSSWIAGIFIIIIFALTAQLVLGVYSKNKPARDFRNEHDLTFVSVVYESTDEARSSQNAGRAYQCETDDAELPNFDMARIMTAAIKEFGDAEAIEEFGDIRAIVIGRLVECAFANRAMPTSNLRIAYGQRTQHE
ncbi:MAG: hypothetical protein HKM24_01175 [Gammaproteobacteria bacterium]|nr:hypothetical protein [Gammaproteobacteria bacterium]